MNRMDPNIAQTEFVRRMLVERPVEPDATYAQDLLALERFLSTKAVGMAESIALSHLVCHVSDPTSRSTCSGSELRRTPIAEFDSAELSRSKRSSGASAANPRFVSDTGPPSRPSIAFVGRFGPTDSPTQIRAEKTRF